MLEDAPSSLQAVVSQAVIALRAGPAASEPPNVVALEPPSAEDETALIFANAGIILMFIGIFSYGSWVLTGVVEEKQSRVVEVVLSTVRPRDLLMGKVLGIGLLALAQLVVLVAVGIGLSQLLGRLVLPVTTPGAVFQLLIWFILGFAFYSTTMGFLGSLASRVEEASTASMPVTLTATTAYILSLVVVTGDPDGVLARVMTFLPPSAPMVVPLRTALGAIEPWEILLSMAIMVATIWFLFVVGARVYSGRGPPDGRPDQAPRRLARVPLTAAGGHVPGDLGVPEAPDQVVVDEPRGLHQRVADRRPDEPEAAPAEVRAHRLRCVRLGRDRAHLHPRVLDRRPADERPQVVHEGRPRVVQGERRPRVADRRGDLRPVADDARVGEEPRDVRVAERRDGGDVEPRERLPVALALAQDRRPRQAGLGALEDEQLEQVALVADGDAPLLVVIGAVGGIRAVAPRAAEAGVGRGGGGLGHARHPSRGRSSAAYPTRIIRFVADHRASPSRPRPVRAR